MNRDASLIGNKPSHRQTYLESMRGICAVIVLFGHCSLAFIPALSGSFTDLFPAMDPAAILTYDYLYFLINGSFAVAFFFVLSGFVLTRRYFLDRDENFILRNLVKRLPRLAAPVVCATLFSWALFKTGAYAYQAAGNVTGSPWLEHFGDANGPIFAPSFWAALWQGAFLTFFRGDHFYDSSLWTMRYEFIGSLMAFGMALLLGAMRSVPIKLFFATTTLLVIHFTGQSWYVGFPVGVLLACLLPRQTRNMPLSIGLILIVVAFWCAGYLGQSIGVFRPIAFVSFGLPAQYLWTLAALILMVVICCCDAVKKILETRFLSFFGWISFPLYLVHVPILCSLGSRAFLFAQHRDVGAWAPVMGFAATLAGGIIVAVPLAFFNDWWMASLNTLNARLLSQQPVDNAAILRQDRPL